MGSARGKKSRPIKWLFCLNWLDIGSQVEPKGNSSFLMNSGVTSWAVAQEWKCVLFFIWALFHCFIHQIQWWELWISLTKYEPFVFCRHSVCEKMYLGARLNFSNSSSVHQIVGLEWVSSSLEEVIWHCGVRMSCMHPSEMDVVHLGIQISVLGFSLFIGAISFSAWRYPLKETVLYFNFRQRCNCTEPMLWGKHVRNIGTEKMCFGQKHFYRHTVMMRELRVTVISLFVLRWKTDETVWKCTGAVRD